MISIIHDLPPRWIFVPVTIMGALVAYYWTWQLLK
jgi:hypothetical protein